MPPAMHNSAAWSIVAAAGNEAQDLGHPTIDDISPDWPPDQRHRSRGRVTTVGYTR